MENFWTQLSQLGLTGDALLAAMRLEEKRQQREAEEKRLERELEEKRLEREAEEKRLERELEEKRLEDKRQQRMFELLKDKSLPFDERTLLIAALGAPGEAAYFCVMDGLLCSSSRALLFFVCRSQHSPCWW
jgi:hypothetical protein